MIGQQIGPYEIIAALGEGGMGAVYRARDTKLNRDVALKVLLPDVANDPERLARFQRKRRCSRRSTIRTSAPFTVSRKAAIRPRSSSSSSTDPRSRRCWHGLTAVLYNRQLCGTSFVLM